MFICAFVSFPLSVSPQTTIRIVCEDTDNGFYSTYNFPIALSKSTLAMRALYKVVK
jgi:hypothetical protein